MLRNSSVISSLLLLGLILSALAQPAGAATADLTVSNPGTGYTHSREWSGTITLDSSGSYQGYQELDATNQSQGYRQNSRVVLSNAHLNGPTILYDFGNSSVVDTVGDTWECWSICSGQIDTTHGWNISTNHQTQVYN